MLAQHRRRSPHTRLALAVLNGRIDQPNGPTPLVLDLHNHIPGPRVLVVQGALDVVDGGVGHALPLEDVEPLGRRLRDADGLDLGLELVPVRYPR